MSVPAQKQLKYTPGIANGSARELAAFVDHARKVGVVPELNFILEVVFLFLKLKYNLSHFLDNIIIIVSRKLP